MAKNKIQHIYKTLHKTYGKQGWWPIEGKYSGKKNLSEKEKLEVCIGAILTQGTAWKNVEKALGNLRKAKALDKRRLLKIHVNELAALIKPAGYYNQKARKIKEFLKFKGEITRENLLSIWGIGPETADSIMLYAYKKPVFVIDAYTKRIFSRLGLCRNDIKYEELQEQFHKSLPRENKIFSEYHALIVEHAKQHCTKKPDCRKCPLSKNCKAMIQGIANM